MKKTQTLASRAAALTAAVILVPSHLLATDYTWNATTQTDWATTTAWTPSGTPSSASDAVSIITAGSGNITTSVDRTVGSFSINSTFGTSSAPQNLISTASNSTLSISNDLTKAGTGAFSFRNSSNALLLTVNVGGNVSVTDGLLQMGNRAAAATALKDLSVSGSVSVSGTSTLGFNVQNTALVAGNLSLANTGKVYLAYGPTGTSGALQVGGLVSSDATTIIAANDIGSGSTTTGNLTINGANGTNTYAGIIKNSNGSSTTSVVNLSKSGGSTQVLTGINTYSGTTTVNNGTLQIGTGGSINGTSGVAINGGRFRYDSATGLTKNVTVSGGTFAYNSSTNFSGSLTFTSGTLAGTNFSGQTLNIGANQTLSPGNSTGTMNAGNVTFANSGTFVFEVNDATGTAGSTTAGWDLLTPTSLNITASTAGFNLKIVSLDSLQSAGLAQNFNAASDYKWMFVNAGSSISSFSADQFTIDTTGFQNTVTGTFAVARGDDIGIGGTSSQLFVTYTASSIPEPSTYAALLGGVGLATAFGLRRRK